MAWDDQYRMLAAGEIIMEGDEVDACRDGWRDEPRWQPARECIGQPAPDPVYPSHRVYRRKVRELARPMTTTDAAIGVAHAIWRVSRVCNGRKDWDAAHGRFFAMAMYAGALGNFADEDYFNALAEAADEIADDHR